jgi:hypothetical protein
MLLISPYKYKYKKLKDFRKIRLVSLSPVITSTPLIYALGKVLFYKYILVIVLFLLPTQLYIMIWIMSYCPRYVFIITYIHTYIYAYIHTYIHIYIRITYIHHGHIWHRNKLPRCQMELLVSSSNDEQQTSLKRYSSSHPVAPECRVA